MQLLSEHEALLGQDKAGNVDQTPYTFTNVIMSCDILVAKQRTNQIASSEDKNVNHSRVKTETNKSMNQSRSGW